jgi:threonine/homoserine/homoserine lactone efflux protein
MDIHVWPFVGISLLVIIVPGPDTVLVTKNAVLHGRGAALGTSLGVNAGLLIWTVAAAFGVAALVRESAVAFTILKLVGGLFALMGLIWLCSYALLASKISDVLTRPAVRKALDRLTGVVLIGLGIRLALERR